MLVHSWWNKSWNQSCLWAKQYSGKFGFSEGTRSLPATRFNAENNKYDGNDCLKSGQFREAISKSPVNYDKSTKSSKPSRPAIRRPATGSITPNPFMDDPFATAFEPRGEQRDSSVSALSAWQPLNRTENKSPATGNDCKRSRVDDSRAGTHDYAGVWLNE